MFDWMSDVFADNSDKARLVAVLVTGLIAVFVLLVNQYFAVRKSRKELLIKKIEEAYQAAMVYERSARSLLKAINRGGRDENGNFALDPSLIEAMNDEVEKLEMLMGLYFPKVKFNKEQYYAGPTLPVMEIAIKEKRVTEDEALEAAHRTRDNISANVVALKKVCAVLMEIHRH